MHHAYAGGRSIPWSSGSSNPTDGCYKQKLPFNGPVTRRSHAPPTTKGAVRTAHHYIERLTRAGPATRGPTTGRTAPPRGGRRRGSTGRRSPAGAESCRLRNQIRTPPPVASRVNRCTTAELYHLRWGAQPLLVQAGHHDPVGRVRRCRVVQRQPEVVPQEDQRLRPARLRLVLEPQRPADARLVLRRGVLRGTVGDILPGSGDAACRVDLVRVAGRLRRQVVRDDVRAAPGGRRRGPGTPPAQPSSAARSAGDMSCSASGWQSVRKASIAVASRSR